MITYPCPYFSSTLLVYGMTDLLSCLTIAVNLSADMLTVMVKQSRRAAMSKVRWYSFTVFLTAHMIYVILLVHSIHILVTSFLSAKI